MTDRPPIPPPMKREVRRRCFFGCVVCGLPIFDYDHIEEFARIRTHETDNLVLLCKNHHGEKTAGRLSKEVVRHYARNPHNKNKGETSPHRHLMMGERASINVGGNIVDWHLGARAAGHLCALEFEGVCLAGIDAEDGNLLLNLLFHGDDGAPVLKVDQGEVVISTGVWDYEMVGRRLVIRSGFGKIVFEMEFAENDITLRRAIFKAPAGGVEVSKEGVFPIMPNGKPIGTFSGNRAEVRGLNVVGVHIKLDPFQVGFGRVYR